MKKKLTLSIEEEIIEKAKAYADGTDRSLSELIENYLDHIVGASEMHESDAVYKFGKKNKMQEKKQWQIPEFLKGIAGTVALDIDYVRDRDKIREERYSEQ